MKEYNTYLDIIRQGSTSVYACICTNIHMYACICTSKYACAYVKSCDEGCSTHQHSILIHFKLDSIHIQKVDSQYAFDAFWYFKFLVHM